jgi:hypothetical protein
LLVVRSLLCAARCIIRARASAVPQMLDAPFESQPAVLLSVAAAMLLLCAACTCTASSESHDEA